MKVPEGYQAMRLGRKILSNNGFIPSSSQFQPGKSPAHIASEFLKNNPDGRYEQRDALNRWFLDAVNQVKEDVSLDTDIASRIANYPRLNASNLNVHTPEPGVVFNIFDWESTDKLMTSVTIIHSTAPYEEAEGDEDYNRMAFMSEFYSLRRDKILVGLGELLKEENQKIGEAYNMNQSFWLNLSIVAYNSEKGFVRTPNEPGVIYSPPYQGIYRVLGYVQEQMWYKPNPPASEW